MIARSNLLFSRSRRIPWHRPPGQVCNPRRLPPMRHPDRRSPVFLINILYGTSQTEGGILSQAWKTTSARPVSPRTRAESAPANCVIAKHPAEGPRQRVRKQSPGTTQPAISRILPPRTKRHQLFKTLPWNSSNQKGLVPQLFLKSPQINISSGEAASSCRRPLQGQESLEYLVLIFPSPCPFTQPSTFDFRPSTI